MSISSMLAEDAVFADVQVTSKCQLLKSLSREAARVLGEDARVLQDRVIQHDNLGSLIVAQAMALSQVQMPVEKPTLFLFKLVRAVDFEEEGEAPVSLHFLLVCPEGSSSLQSKSLAQLARLLRSSDLRRRLIRSRDQQELYQLMLHSEALDSAA